MRSTTNPAARELTADDPEKITNTPAAKVALNPFSSKIEVWWNTKAVDTNPGVPKDNANSQKFKELNARMSRRKPDAACLDSDTGGSSLPSGNIPISSGRFLTTSKVTGTINRTATTPITA